MKTIDFEITNGEYIFRDAIVITDDQYASMTESDIEAEKLRRWNEWLAIVNPPSEDEA